MAKAFGSSSNVFEVHDKDSYLDWSETTKAYLEAKDLWDVVDSGKKEEKDWEKKNAAALHAIRISCCRQNLRFIRRIIDAKEAWQTLKDTFDPQPEQLTSYYDSLDQFPDEENGIPNDYKESLKSLQDALSNENWGRIVRLCDKTPGLLKEKNPNRKNVPVLHHYLFLGKGFWENRVIKTLKSDEFPKEALDEKNSSGGTALTVAVGIGSIDIVKCIVEMNKELLSIPNNSRHLPVVTAIGSRFHDIADYLYQETPEKVWSNEEFGATLIINCIKVRKLDIAIKLLKKNSNLMLVKDANGKTPMYYAACAPSLFCITHQYGFLRSWIFNWLCPWLRLKLLRKYSMNMKVSGIELLVSMGKAIKDSKNDPMKTGIVNDEVLEAIKRGNFILFFIWFINEVFMKFPDESDNTIKNMCMCAIEYRRTKVFSIFFDDEMKQYTNFWRDKLNNNILHIAAKLAPPTVLGRISGPALQIQRELQWFKEVEKLVPPSLSSSENIDHMTPRALFTMNHKDLMVEGEKWMKYTASSCTIVGPLIITIMFAAAFQVPGGNDQVKGFPIFLNNFLLKLYIVSVAISFFSATTSVLVFLKILTSNYTEEDFLKPLPNKMIIGLSTLFLSLATMIVAFCSGLFLTFHGELRILVPIITLAAFPVGYFGWTQFPLLVEIWTSTYMVAIFDRDIYSRVVFPLVMHLEDNGLEL